VLASIQAGRRIRAIHSWQPIGDYSLVIANGKGSKLADLAGKILPRRPGRPARSAAAHGERKYGIDESTARFVQVGATPPGCRRDRRARRRDVINTVTALKGVRTARSRCSPSCRRNFPGSAIVWNVVRTDPEQARACGGLSRP